MPKTTLGLVAVLIASAWMTVHAPASRAQADPPTQNGSGFALLELFTSEGCSSCPAADRVFAEIDAEVREAGQPVYTLAYHVDYWDGLGWPDRFAEAAFTQRQRDYATAFGSDRVYTPQMVVNGGAEFNGARGDLAREFIRRARFQPVHGTVQLSVERPDRLTAEIAATVADAPPGMVLHVALVQRRAVTEVGDGENADLELQHVNIVRGFHSAVPAGDTNPVVLDIPEADADEPFEVVAFLQWRGVGPITAATRAALPELTAAAE